MKLDFLNWHDASETVQKQAWELYEFSFPLHERRSYASHMRAMQDPNFDCRLVMDGNQFVGLLWIWKWSDLVFVEHLAIEPALRGKNYGSYVLQALIDQSNDSLVILEIDPPVDEISVRRLHFYQRMGFLMNQYPYTHPSYCIPSIPHSLELLTYGREASREELDRFCRLMKEQVWAYIGN